MMQHNYYGVLTLVRSALEGRGYPLPEGFSLAEVYSTIRLQNLDNIALEGAVLCGIGMEQPQMQRLFQTAAQCVMVVQKQQAGLQTLEKAFADAQIDYMPMKGVLLRGLYPKAEYRTMGDADILIRPEQYDKIALLMEQLGYRFLAREDNCYVWESSRLKVELHDTLLPTEPVFHDYYRDGWAFAKEKSGCRYTMTHEDAYIYVFTHMAKHFRFSGVGIRQLVDLWLLQKEYPDMNHAYIRQELEKLQLVEFHEHILQTLQVWFADAQPTSTTQLITAYVCESGVFGDYTREIMGNMLHQQGESSGLWSKCKAYWNMIWLPLPKMRQQYPVLEKWPILLPGCWILRIFRLLFRDRSILRQKNAAMTQIKDSDVLQHKKLFKEVGMKDDFLE